MTQKMLVLTKLVFEDLAEKIKSGFSEFDLVIATPDTMRVVGQLGQILGPKGMMPNPKDGTVTKNVKDAVIKAKTGQIRFRNDKGGVVHCSIGKTDFSEESIKQNLESLLDEIVKKQAIFFQRFLYKKNYRIFHYGSRNNN